MAISYYSVLGASNQDNTSNNSLSVSVPVELGLPINAILNATSSGGNLLGVDARDINVNITKYHDYAYIPNTIYGDKTTINISQGATLNAALIGTHYSVYESGANPGNDTVEVNGAFWELDDRHINGNFLSGSSNYVGGDGFDVYSINSSAAGKYTLYAMDRSNIGYKYIQTSLLYQGPETSESVWMNLYGVEEIRINDVILDLNSLIGGKNISINTLIWSSNSAPSDLTLTSSGVLENSIPGTVIGSLAATDPDAGSTFTYALVAGNGTNDADNNLVEIVSSQVKVKSGASIDFETNPTLNLNIKGTDNGNPGLSYTKAVTANVLNVNETPTYTVTQAPTTAVAEGATLTTTVQTTDLAQGTEVFWSAGGTNIDADDFTAGALSGTGTVGTDGRFSISHTLKNDNKTEVNETLQVKLYSDNARSIQVGSTASTTITDSSKTPPTYTVTQAPTPAVAEGATLTTSVQTTELAEGTNVYWSATGTGIDADDFTAGALSGTGTVGADGRFSFTHSIKNDNKTEGNETLQVKLYSDNARSIQVGSTASTTITDSSKTPPTYSVTQSSNSINEGGTLNTTVKTTDLAVGTKVYWSADGTRIDAKDFSAGALSGEGIVGADGTFTFSHTLAYDNKTEGNENLQIKLYSDSARTSQVGNTSSTTIVDTSRNSVIVTKQEGDAHAGINEDLPRDQSNVVGIKATSLDVNGNGDFISDVDSTSTADATTGNGNASTHVRQSILGISISDSSRIGGEGKFSSIITHDSANSASANNGNANVEDHLNTVGIDVSTLRVQGKSTFSSFMSTRSQNSADATQTNDENISTNVSASLNRNQLLGEPNIVGMRFDRLTLDNNGVFTSQLENTSDTGAVSIKGDANTFSNNSVLGIGFNGASRITGDAQVTSLLTQRSFSDAQSVHGTAITEDHHSVIGIEAHDLTVTGNATFSSTVVVRALSNSGT